jgi:hypothetical protein
MLCKKCGKVIHDEYTFCINCGTAKGGQISMNTNNKSSTMPLAIKIIIGVVIVAVVIVSGVLIKQVIIDRVAGNLQNMIFGYDDTMKSFLEFADEQRQEYEELVNQAPTTISNDIVSTNETRTDKSNNNDAGNNKIKNNEPISLAEKTINTPLAVIDYKTSVKTKTSEEDGLFTGDIINGLPNGHGKFVQNGLKNTSWYYEGNFVDGCFDGEGMVVNNNGITAVGNFKNNMLNGAGKQYVDKGLLFDGLFADNVRHGYGKLYKDGEIVYEGNFNNGIPDEASFKESCRFAIYDDLVRIPSLFQYMPLMVQGKVTKIVEQKDKTTLYQVATRNGKNDILYVIYDKRDDDLRILKDDVVTFWGLGYGLLSFDTMYGNIKDYPGLHAYHMTIEGY